MKLKPIQLLLILGLTSCSNQQKANSDIIDTGVSFSTAKSTESIVSRTETYQHEKDSLLKTEEFSNWLNANREKYEITTTDPKKLEQLYSMDWILSRRRPEPPANEELPLSYTKRTFISGLSSSTYDIFTLPGKLLKYDKQLDRYSVVTALPVTKDGLSPEASKIEDGVLYNSKIDKGASFNASFLIGGLKVEEKQMMELIVTDIAKSFLPNELIDEPKLKRIIDQIAEEELANYYFISSVTLTFIHNKRFKKTSFEAKVNTSYITAGGNVYGSNEKFQRERIVSTEIVNLKDLILTTPSISTNL